MQWIFPVVPGMSKTGFVSSESREMLEHLLSTGMFEARRGNIPLATEIYRKISSLQLEHVSDYRRAGALASLVGQHENAIRHIRVALEMASDSREVWVALGDACSNSGDIEQGVRAYEKALEIDPDVVLHGLAQAYDLIGMHERADRELDRIAKFRFGRSGDGDNHDEGTALFFACLPKSAGTSLCRAIEQCTGISQGGIVAITDHDYFPNSRISPGAFFTTIRHPVQLHTHVRATRHNLGLLTQSGIRQLLVHVRDPRQSFVSYYFHSQNAMGLIRSRYANPEFDSLDDQERFRWFMEFYYPRFINWIAEWFQVELQISGYPFSLHISTFEDMLKTGQAGLVRDVCDFYGVVPNSPPVEQKHRLRKGIADEWRSVIPESYHPALWDMIPANLAERFGWRP